MVRAVEKTWYFSKPTLLNDAKVRAADGLLGRASTPQHFTASRKIERREAQSRAQSGPPMLGEAEDQVHRKPRAVWSGIWDRLLKALHQRDPCDDAGIGCVHLRFLVFQKGDRSQQ